MPAFFVHLHIHTEYSLADGIVRIKDLARAAAEEFMPAVAITDIANLYGAVKFYRACVEQGVKPIIGADVWVENPSDPTTPDRLLLLCRTQSGYKMLCRLLTIAHGRHSATQKVCLPYQELTDAAKEFIAITNPQDGEIAKGLRMGNYPQAQQLSQHYKQYFGENLYLGISRMGHQHEVAMINGARELSEALDIALLATNQVQFVKASDFHPHEVKVCIQQGRVLDDSRRPQLFTEQQYLRSTEDMVELFSDIPEALENTLEIAKRCNVVLSFDKTFLPAFPLGKGNTAEKEMVKQSSTGLKRFLKNCKDINESEYKTRLMMEQEVINEMGFAGYFLIVADFIRWAKENRIPVGPGRGSGAGSLVAYTLGITDLDPIAEGLLFERFLNPERVSMPDFDIDFCMEGRDRVIEYVTEKYGEDKVSQIITYGTMAARAVVRDVGRVMGLSYGFVDGLAKLVPFEPGMTLEKAFAQEALLRERYSEEEDVKQLIDLARSLEGLARNVGRHAGGVVIAPSTLTDYTALYSEPGMTQALTHFDKDDLEAIGLVKFDFLGLRTLTIIDKALKHINPAREARGENPVDFDRLPTDDGDTYNLVKTGKTTALFQLESRGMKDLIQRLGPDKFDDLVALVALFRPGPLQSGMVDDFVDRRHGRAAVKYPHPEVESILKPTYGVILYQEQVMQIAQVLAGYTLGAADLLRRAMGKKKPEEMAQQRKVFVDGAVDRGVDNATATHIFDLMEKFAGYGFNKSHSAAYALITYQTAWLKAHHPAAFMAAALSSDMEHTDKIVTLIAECRDLDLKIQPPDINKCVFEFIPLDSEKILYGLGAIKGIGRPAIDSILTERETNGPFANLYDFCQRIDDKRVNKRALEALVGAGAMDGLVINLSDTAKPTESESEQTKDDAIDHLMGQARAELMMDLPVAMSTANQYSSDQQAGQSDLFGVVDNTTPVKQQRIVTPWNNEKRLLTEKETLGLYLTGHPIQDFANDLGQIIDAPVAALNPTTDKTVIVAGLVVALRTLNTRRGDKMAFVTLDDQTGRIELSIFSDLYNDNRDIVRKDKLLVVSGQVSVDETTGGFEMRADSVHEITQLREQFAVQVTITLHEQTLHSDIFTEMEKLFVSSSGECPVIIRYMRTDHSEAFAKLEGANAKVKPRKRLLDALYELVGRENVALRYRRADFANSTNGQSANRFADFSRKRAANF